MLRNAVKMLTRNIGFKLLALLFAVVMWMAVVNLNDPDKNRSFTIPVTVENENVIARMDKYYEIDNDSMNVTFNVSGKRSIIDALSNSDFKAVADMTLLVQGGEENVVPVEITALRYASQVSISNRTRQIRVSLEDLRRETFDIQAVAQGKPAEGYALGEMEVTPNRLRISGPKAVVSQIDTIKAVIDVTDISTGITDSVVPVLLNKKNEAMDTTKLTLNLSTVTVKAEIISEKTVPIRVSYSGTPADGYEVISAKAKPSEVKIKGRSDILNSISSIVIPESDVSVDGADQIVNQQIDINQYLPEGVSLSDSTEAKIIVTVDVEQLERRTFRVPVRNIGIDNLPEGSKIDFNDTHIDIVLYGLKADLDALQTNEIRPVLDVGGLMPGQHVRQLRLSLDGAYIAGDTEVSFTIRSENANQTGNSTQAGSSDQTQDDGEEEGDTQDSSGGQEEDTAGDPEKEDTGQDPETGETQRSSENEDTVPDPEE